MPLPQTCRIHSFPLPDGFHSVDRYLESLISLYNEPLVQKLAGEIHILDFFLTEPDLLESCVPTEWLEFFDNEDPEAVIDFLISHDKSEDINPPDSLVQFLSRIRSLSINRSGPSDVGTLSSCRTSAISLGMSPKKVYECELLSDAVAAVCRTTSATHVIDLGSGKGYLSRMLAFLYNYRVVAIESKESRAQEADKLDSLYMRRGGEAFLKRQNTKSGSLVHIALEVKDGDLNPVVSKVRLENERVVLVGLHTCGNLAHHALSSLNMTKCITGVAVVGCCFNQMTEKCVDHDDIGFPMSRTLEHFAVALPTSARMLACQAPGTWTKETRGDFFVRHFYRALLQRIFMDRGILADGRAKLFIGSMRKQWYKSFHTYCMGACAKASENYRVQVSSISTDLFLIDRQTADTYFNTYKHKQHRLSILWTLMSCVVAPLTETLIHLDRFYYLAEIGASEVHVSVIFDQSISARNLLVVGI
ncbi:methyltransferase domain-containing protein, partial [Lipomyces oligophaga]|uniref:methyltransferase domain-containing protein n=1 Tax=Lipomyces oligophaga TaxID=45792 RepID=UPI0034CDCDAD